MQEEPPTWRDFLIALPIVWVVSFVTAFFRARVNGDSIETWALGIGVAVLVTTSTVVTALWVQFRARKK